MSLEQKYFDQIYAKESLIDGDYNASRHARYIKSLFDLVEVEVSSLVDFGFGKGKLLYHLNKSFHPGKCCGIDNSKFAYEYLKSKSWVKELKINLKQQSLVDYVPPKKAFDLGVCNSVLQYIGDQHLESCIERMSYSCRYLYLHVPSKEDYSKLKFYSDFVDPYAIQREDSWYRELIEHYFVKVSWGLLESKNNVDKDLSAFFDSLYRD